MPERKGHLCLFRLPGEESANNAARLRATAHAAGWHVHSLCYWPDPFLTPDAEDAVLSVDLGSATRLSAWAFRTKYGFDVPTLDLAAHNLATEAVTAELLLTESVWHQRLRGWAAAICERLQTVPDACVAVPHGAEVLSRIIDHVARQLGHPIVYWESGFLPDHLYLDTQAPHFFRGLCSADLLPPSEALAELGAVTVSGWVAARQSKYVQSAGDSERLNRWLAATPLKTLFIAGQVATDANVVTSLGSFASLADLYDAVLQALPDDWRVLFKPHPRDPAQYAPYGRLPPERLFVGDVDIRHAVTASQAVLVHSSNVGLEALMLGACVIVTGAPVYAREGLTQRLDEPRQLVTLLARLEVPSADKVQRLVGHLQQTALLRDADIEGFNLRIEGARHEAPEDRFYRYYPESVRTLIRAGNALAQSLKTASGLDAALANLEPDDRRALDAYLLDEKAVRPFAGPRFDQPVGLLERPGLKHPKGAAHKRVRANLQNRAEPGQWLAGVIKDRRRGWFTVPLANGAEVADIQSFDPDTLRQALDQSGVAYLAFSTSGSSDATIYLGDQLSSPFKAKLGPWLLPPAVFQYPDAHAPDTGCRLDVNHVHPHFGPFVDLPEGEWRIRHPFPVRLMYAALSSLGKRFRPNLRLEVIEHDAETSRPILESDWYRPTGRFTTTAGCKYELRARTGKPRKGQRGPRFYGFVLEPLRTYAVNWRISAP